MFTAYILQSGKNLEYYIGSTGNLNDRIKRHNKGYSKYTKGRGPFKLIHKEEYETLSEAKKREWFFKCTPRGGKLKRKIIMNFLNGRDGGHKVA